MCDLVHLSQGFFVAEQRTEADACIMDEEAVACVTTKESRASTRIRHRQHDRDSPLRLRSDRTNDDDLRHDPLEVCNASMRVDSLPTRPLGTPDSPWAEKRLSVTTITSFRIDVGYRLSTSNKGGGYV
jgi:hypothetical protein